MTAQQQLRGDVAVLVPAAGLGTRLGPGEPKALRELGGASLLVHAVRRASAAPSVGCLVVAAPVGKIDVVRALLIDAIPSGIAWYVVAGGAERQDSVAAALAAAPASYPIVLVHDAARAFAPPSLFERVAQAVRTGHGAVIPVLPVIDTIKEIDSSGYVISTVDRTVLRAVQTPQGFRRDVLDSAHRQAAEAIRAGMAEPATDDAGLVERMGFRVSCVDGSEEAMKITQPADLVLARALGLVGRTLG